MKGRTIIVNSNCYHGFPVKDALSGIAEAGFHNVELTATKGWTEHVFPSMSFSGLVEIKAALKDHGLSVPAMSGHCNLMDKNRLHDFTDNIHLAAFFGARYIVSSVGEAHLKDMASSGDLELKNNIMSFLPLLEDCGLKLVLETHGEHGTAARLARIVEIVDSPSVRICYDTANAVFYGDVKGTEDAAANAGLIEYIHIKDKAGERTEWNFPALGEGWLDLPSILKTLDEKGNTAPLSIEIEFTRDGASSSCEVDEAVYKSGLYLKNLGYVL